MSGTESEITILGLHVLKEEDVANRSIFRNIIGITMTLIMSFLLMLYFTIVLEVLLYKDALVAFLKNSVWSHMSHLFLYISIIISVPVILRGFIKVLIEDRKIGIKRELTSYSSGGALLTFSEAFYAAFFLSMITIFIFPLKDVAVSGDYNTILALCYLAILIAPMLEESIFRFALLLLPIYLKDRFFKKRSIRLKRVLINGKRNLDFEDIIIVIISSLLFGLAHLTSWSWSKVPQAFLLGIFLAYIALRGGIFSSIIFHWAWNSFALALYVLIILGVPFYIVLFMIMLLMLPALGLGIVAIIVLMVRIIRGKEL